MYYKLTFYFRLFNLSSYFLDIIRSSTAHDLLFIVCWTVKNDGVTCMCVYSLLLPYVYSGHAIFTLTPPICVSSDRARETPQNPQLTSKSWVSSVSVRLFSCFKMIFFGTGVPLSLSFKQMYTYVPLRDVPHIRVGMHSVMSDLPNDVVVAPFFDQPHVCSQIS